MSISLNANFELLSAGLYLDARQQFNTIIEMKDFAETSIPDGFITYNKETQKHYVFSSSNTVDGELGKWKECNISGVSNEFGSAINIWQPNTEYKVNDLCLYKETDYYSAYICVTEHTSTDAFVSAYWETIDGTEFEGYTEDEILAMLNLSEEELQNLQNLIQDNVISTTSTFSSSKIYAELLTLREELDKVFQNVDNGKNLIASAITDKGINTSKDDTFETMANNISSIIQSDMNVIHNTMENLGYDYTDLSGLNVYDTARLISKYFILKQASENVSNIMSATAEVNFNNFLIDGKLQDFGNVINPVYTKETINQTINTVNNVFVSDDISVELINVYMGGV